MGDAAPAADAVAIATAVETHVTTVRRRSVHHGSDADARDAPPPGALSAIAPVGASSCDPATHIAAPAAAQPPARESPRAVDADGGAPSPVHEATDPAAAADEARHPALDAAVLPVDAAGAAQPPAHEAAAAVGEDDAAQPPAKPADVPLSAADAAEPPAHDSAPSTEAEPELRAMMEAPPHCAAGRIERWLARLVLVVLLSCGFALVLADLSQGGLGPSNSKFVSFLASLASCADYRAQKPIDPRSPPPRWRRSRPAQRLSSGRIVAPLFHAASAASVTPLRTAARVLAGNLLAKFGAATVGSVLLLEAPVILKGPRHLLSFVTALLAVQLCPFDVVYRAIEASAAVQLLLRTSAAVYKLRKLVFVIIACRHISISLAAAYPAALGDPGSEAHLVASTAHALLVAWVIMDGTSVLRSLDTWLRCRGFPKASREGSWARALGRLGREARAAIAERLLRFRLLALLTVALVCIDGSDAPQLACDALRAITLVALFRRHKVFTTMPLAARELVVGSKHARAAVGKAAGGAASAIIALAPAAAEYVAHRRHSRRRRRNKSSPDMSGASDADVSALSSELSDDSDDDATIRAAARAAMRSSTLYGGSSRGVHHRRNTRRVSASLSRSSIILADSD